MIFTSSCSAFVNTGFASSLKGSPLATVNIPYVFSILKGITHTDENNEVIGYQFVRLGKMLEDIRHGMEPNEAYKKNIG